MLRVEGSAAAANPIDLDKRRSARAQAALQADFAELATTVDNATFLGGLAKAPLKAGLRAITKSAESRAASVLAAEAAAETAAKTRTTIAAANAERAGLANVDDLLHPPKQSPTTQAIENSADRSTAIERSLLDESRPTFNDITRGTEPPRQPLRLTHQPTTHTIEEVRQLPQPEKWKAGEQHIRELHGATGSRRFEMRKEGGQSAMSARVVDSVTDLPNGTILAGEVKTYNRSRIVNGASRDQSVPLSRHIRQQVLKDVRLRRANPQYDPRWFFLDAPPSDELSAFLRKHKIVTIIHL